jgi:hypothetical protein
MSYEEMKAELERLRNENSALKKGAATGSFGVEPLKGQGRVVSWQ